MRTRLLAALTLIFVTVPALAEAPADAKATIAYLQKLQTKEGGFVPEAGSTKPGLRATSSALHALRYFGGDATDRVAAARFVESCYDKARGGFADTPGGKPDLPTTAVAALALVELKVPTAPYEDKMLRYLGTFARDYEGIRIAAAAIEALKKQPPEAAEWLRRIEQERNRDGSFGGPEDARMTGGAYVLILRLGGKVEHPEQVVSLLNQCQHEDGAFGKGEKDEPTELETTYRVLRCYHMLKAKPHVPRLREYIAKCRNADGGYGVAPGKPSTVSGTYYAGVILHWLAEP